MHVERGGAWVPRQVIGQEARRRLDREIRTALVKASSGLPGVKPDRVYEIRSGRVTPWTPLRRALEQMQDIGASEEAEVISLELLRQYLRARRELASEQPKAAA